MAKEPNLIEVQNLTKIFETGFIKKKQVLAVDDVTFDIPEKKSTILTLVGESGSGKSTTARLILGLIKPTSGRILYKGKDLWTMNKTDWFQYLRDVQSVFQDPYGAYNFFRKVDNVLTTPIRNFHLTNSKEEEGELIAKSLETVGLRAEYILGKYPHQLSGGERQRIMLARALLIFPKLVIADEPVSMVDASIRANILNVMLDLKRKNNLSFLYITHDLSTARYLSDDILVMYLGEIVESGPVDDVVLNPQHPYVKILVDSVPKPDPENKWKERVTLEKTIASSQYSPTKGCKFYARCPNRMDKCVEQKPRLVDLGGNHKVSCFIQD